MRSLPSIFIALILIGCAADQKSATRQVVATPAARQALNARATQQQMNPKLDSTTDPTSSAWLSSRLNTIDTPAPSRTELFAKLSDPRSAVLALAAGPEHAKPRVVNSSISLLGHFEDTETLLMEYAKSPNSQTQSSAILGLHLLPVDRRIVAQDILVRLTSAPDAGVSGNAVRALQGLPKERQVLEGIITDESSHPAVRRLANRYLDQAR